MRAITYNRYGAAREVLTLGDHPVAQPGPGEVTVALAYSGVNPSDVKRRASARPGIEDPGFAAVCPHSDGAGVIEAVGADVPHDRIGQRVWIWNGHWQRSWGTAAEKITLAQDQAVPLPESISLETGASLGIPGLTAAHCVLGGGSVAGKRLLIHGAAGNVGFLALQIAKWADAEVFATASPDDFDRCTSAGADHVFDYRSPTLAQDIMSRSGGQPMDRIVDVEFGANVTANTEVIAPNGTISVYGSQKNTEPTLPFYPLLFKAVTLDFALIYILPADERRDAINALHTALTAGALTCPVDRVFSLAQTAQAHEHVEAGGRAGATLIDVRA